MKRIAEAFLTSWFEGFSNRPEGLNNNAEIDFLIKHEQHAIPVEIKAGAGGSLKLLQQFCYLKNCRLAVRFDLNPPSVQKVRAIIRIGCN